MCICECFNAESSWRNSQVVSCTLQLTGQLNLQLSVLLDKNGPVVQALESIADCKRWCRKSSDCVFSSLKLFKVYVLSCSQLLYCFYKDIKQKTATLVKQTKISTYQECACKTTEQISFGRSCGTGLMTLMQLLGLWEPLHCQHPAPFCLCKSCRVYLWPDCKWLRQIECGISILWSCIPGNPHQILPKPQRFATLRLAFDSNEHWHLWSKWKVEFHEKFFTFEHSTCFSRKSLYSRRASIVPQTFSAIHKIMTILITTHVSLSIPGWMRKS